MKPVAGSRYRPGQATSLEFLAVLIRSSDARFAIFADTKVANNQLIANGAGHLFQQEVSEPANRHIRRAPDDPVGAANSPFVGKLIRSHRHGRGGNNSLKLEFS